MQKSGVKTLSIIDTISELAQNENEASRLTLPSPIGANPHGTNPHGTNPHGANSQGANGAPSPRSPIKKKFSSPVISVSSSTRSAGSHGGQSFEIEAAFFMETLYFNQNINKI